MQKEETLRLIENLRALQEIDALMALRQAEINSLPERQQAIEAQLQATRAAISDLQEQVKSQQAHLRQQELETESLRQQIAKLRTQQFQIKSNVEYRALNTEIENLEEKIRQTDDQAIQTMEKVEQLRRQIKDMEAVQQKETARVQAELEALNARRKVLEDELQGVRAQRAKLAQAIAPAAWLQTYERILANRKDYAIVPIDANGFCGGCHMKLTAQVIHDARKFETIVACIFCGRLLYYQA